MKKILITMTLLFLSTNACFADGVLDNVLNTVQEINYGVPPSEVAKDYAYQYAQQKANYVQQQNYNVQNSNNQYQNSQYQVSPVNPYQNVNVDNSASQNFLINPFGSFQWDDGVFDVINKLKAMHGVTEIYFSYYNSAKQSINLKNVPKEKLAGVINSYLLKDTAAEAAKYNRQTHSVKIIPSRINSENFVDSNGKTKPYFDHQVTINAKAVFIENTPFEITITFGTNKGVTVYKPSNVIKDSTGYFYPLYMGDITLESSSVLADKTWRQIEQICRNKFSAITNTQSDASTIEDPQSNESDWTVTDKKDNVFSFRYVDNCVLSYSRSSNYSDYLDNLYKQHLIKLESQKYKSVPNSNSQI